MTSGFFPWRPPLGIDWREDYDRIVAAISSGTGIDYAELKALANRQLGVSEQLKIERLAKKIVKSGQSVAGLDTVRLGLLGNRTTSFLPAPLAAAGLARGLQINSIEAPYDSVASFAFSPADCFGQELDALLVMLDETGFAGDRPLIDAGAENDALAEAEQLVSSLTEAARNKTSCRAIFATLPGSSNISSADLSVPGSPARFRARFNIMLADGARRGDWLIWDQAALAERVGLANWFDPISYHSAKVPFRVDFCPLAADHIASQLAAMKGKAARALVLDLDNTIWGGVIGDDGVSGIRLGQNSAEGEAYAAVQRFLLSLRQRGVVLAVCSKNNDETARAPFRDHSEMVLKEKHIAAFQANWNDKATNIQSISDMLSLGLESIAFIDDNAAERERVRQELPLVSTIEIGDDPSFYIDRIAQSGLFDHLPLTLEDTARADSYGGRAEAAQIKARIGNYDDYLTSLQMQMQIDPFDDAGRARITQLINKSNQFNLTTKRYGEEDVRAIQASADKMAWQVRLEDKFAKHGMIAVVIAEKEVDHWTIDTWLQSCRVLERGVEQCVMDALFKQAAASNVQTIRARYIPTAKNAMVADFFDRFKFSRTVEHDSGQIEYECDVGGYQPHKTFIEMIFDPG